MVFSLLGDSANGVIQATGSHTAISVPLDNLVLLLDRLITRTGIFLCVRSTNARLTIIPFILLAISVGPTVPHRASPGGVYNFAEITISVFPGIFTALSSTTLKHLISSVSTCIGTSLLPMRRMF